MPDGNEAAVRIIGNQLFDIWEERQKQEKGRLPASVPAWIGCILAVAGLIWSAAVISGNVSENTRRIDRVEIEVRQQAGDNRQLAEQMARIEAKVDIILGERQ